MKKPNNGGSAFPSEQSLRPDGMWNDTLEPGMSLRDWFAGKALAGDWASQSSETGEFTDSVSDYCLRKRAALYYRMADAMIAEKEAI